MSLTRRLIARAGGEPEPDPEAKIDPRREVARKAETPDKEEKLEARPVRLMPKDRGIGSAFGRRREAARGLAARRASPPEPEPEGEPAPQPLRRAEAPKPEEPEEQPPKSAHRAISDAAVMDKEPEPPPRRAPAPKTEPEDQPPRRMARSALLARRAAAADDEPKDEAKDAAMPLRLAAAPEPEAPEPPEAQPRRDAAEAPPDEEPRRDAAEAPPDDEAPDAAQALRRAMPRAPEDEPEPAPELRHQKPPMSARARRELPAATAPSGAGSEAPPRPPAPPAQRPLGYAPIPVSRPPVAHSVVPDRPKVVIEQIDVIVTAPTAPVRPGSVSHMGARAVLAQRWRRL